MFGRAGGIGVVGASGLAVTGVDLEMLQLPHESRSCVVARFSRRSDSRHSRQKFSFSLHLARKHGDRAQEVVG